jgi:putative endonuclease
MTDHIKTGSKGEKLATEFLENNGYKILEKNWRSGRYEIDIIAEEKNILVFIEVKTRTTDYYGYPEESVNKTKQDHILQAAEDYVILNNINREIRFDIISIIINGNIQKIYHVVDAIAPYSE